MRTERFLLIITIQLLCIAALLAGISLTLAGIRNDANHERLRQSDVEQTTHITSDPTANYLIDPTGCGCVPLPDAAR